MRTVSVYKRGPELFLVSNVESPEGILVVSEPRFKLSAGEPDHVLGNHLLKCLNHPVQEIPFPTDKKLLLKELLLFLGVRRWTDFVKGVSLVSVRRDKADLLSIVPMEQTERGAFRARKDIARISFEKADLLGQAVKKSLGVN